MILPKGGFRSPRLTILHASCCGAAGNPFAGGGNTSARFNDTTKVLEIDSDGDATADMEITRQQVRLADLDAADFTVTAAV